MYLTRRASGGPAGAIQLGNFLDVRDRCARAGAPAKIQ
jgi:hypothetical protein